jgi:hypothetical protein
VKEDKRGSMEGSRAPPTEPGSIVLSYFVSTDGSCVQLPVLSVSMESVFSVLSGLSVLFSEEVFFW